MPSLCLDGTYFTFRNVTYQQIYGTSMGSTVSVVVANLVMEHVEKLAISSFVRKPRCWKRYVDDVCCSVQECDVNDLLVHLNSIEPSIQFTCEVEKNCHLPYLASFWSTTWMAPSQLKCTGSRPRGVLWGLEHPLCWPNQHYS